MTTVLIVDDDVDLRESLARELGNQGFTTLAVGSAQGAVEILRREDVDVLVTDLRMSGPDGIDLLKSAREVAPRVQAVLMSAFATARDHQLATELGAVRVLPKPFTPRELRQAVDQALESRQGFRGSVHGLSLIDMLQMFHFGKRSLTITLGGLRRASIHFDNGEIVHAEHDLSEGEHALRVILSSESGSVYTTPLQEVPRTVERSFESLLLDLLRQVDEASRSSIPPAFDDWDFGGLGEPAHHEQKGEANMSKIDDSCKSVVEKVDGAVACGVVDLDTGMVLGVHNNAGYSQTLNEVVAAAAMDMFRGPNVSRVEQMVRSHRGIPENGEHYFHEIHVSSKNNFHFMKTLKGGKAVIVLVTSKSTSVGMGWASLKSVIPEVEPLVP